MSIQVSKTFNVSTDFSSVYLLIVLILAILRKRYSLLTDAYDLLVALEQNPNFGSGSSTAEVDEFIDSIEKAEPNACDYDEDDLGVSWGHRQLCGWHAILTSWVAIGSPGTACQLIASILKTCVVACKLCRDEEAVQQSKGEDSLNYLSDMYLQEIMSHLWGLWKSGGGVS